MAAGGQRGRDLPARVGAGPVRAVGPAGCRACRAAARTACSRRRLRHRARRAPGGGSGRRGWAGHGSGREPGHARGRCRAAGSRRRPDRLGRGQRAGVALRRGELRRWLRPTRDSVLSGSRRRLTRNEACSCPERARGRDGLAGDDRAPGFALLAAALGRTISSDAEAHARTLRSRRRRRAGEAARGGWPLRLRDTRGNRNCPIRLGGDVRPQPSRPLTPSPRSSPPHRHRPTKSSYARSRVSSTAHRAGLAVLPDRGASRALPRVIAAHVPCRLAAPQRKTRRDRGHLGNAALRLETTP